MTDFKSQGKYIIKNAHGKLQMKSELEIIDLLAKKAITPDTKVFVMMLNQWSMVKNLCLFTKKSSYSPTKEFDSETHHVDSEINVEFNESVDYIHLLNNFEDAKEIAKKTQIEFIERINTLEIDCHIKKERIRYLENLNHTFINNQKTLQKDYQELQKSIEKSNKIARERDTRDSEMAVLQSEVHKRILEQEIFQNDIAHIKKINQELHHINSSLKKDYSELLELNERTKLHYEKILIEKKFYEEKINDKNELIEKLQSELSLIKSLYHSAVEKFENYSFDYTEYKKQVGIYRLDIDVINLDRDRLQEEQKKLNDELKKLNEQINNLKMEIERRDGELLKTHSLLKTSEHKNQRLVEENHQLTQKIDETEKLLVQLKTLPPVPSDYIPMAEHEQVLEKNLTQTKEQFNKQLQDLTKKIDQLEREASLLQSNFNITLQEKNELQELCRTQNIKIKKLVSFKDYAAKKMSDTITSYNSKIVDFKNTLSKQKNEYSKIITKLKDVKQDEVKIDELLEVQSKMADTNKVEDIDSVGELFEVSNDKIWKVKLKDLTNNLYSILELKHMFEEKEINSETSIKKLGDNWKKVSDTFEMNTTLFTKQLDDELRIFIKRDDFRIPCSFNLKVDYLGQQYQAICSNLSASGCFVTLKNAPQSIFDEGGVMKIYFPKFESTKTVVIDCEIKRIEKTDQTGCGLKFSQINNEIKSFIDSHLHVFSASLNKSA
jgi:chromosome segregation ATPase